VIGDILTRLEKVKQTGRSNWLACCPAHDDKRPSMTLHEADDGRILCHCWTGCSFEAIVNAVGLGWEPWFPPKINDDFKPPVRRPYPAADVLAAVADETILVALAACDMAHGVSLSEEDRERLWTAHSRIVQAREAIGG
jgi:hypothetical protein